MRLHSRDRAIGSMDYPDNEAKIIGWALIYIGDRIGELTSQDAADAIKGVGIELGGLAAAVSDLEINIQLEPVE